MTQEEKAQRYDEAYKRVAVRFSSNVADEIFLKESEDERVRKEIITYLSTVDDKELIPYESWIDWLEKQGEQKLVYNGKHRLLTVGRAKEMSPFTRSGFEQKTVGSKGMDLVEEEMTPFQKKVFCIVDTAIEEEQGLSNICNELLALAKQEIGQKPAWGEEDEAKFESCIKVLQTSDGYDTINTKWLKSLKDRIQPKQEWGEEDKRKLDRIYFILRQASDNHAFSTTCRLIGDKECVELQDFLKSIKDRCTWKPSDEQMKILDEVLNFAAGHENTYWNDYIFGILNSLVKQLKKLKE